MPHPEITIHNHQGIDYTIHPQKDGTYWLYINGLPVDNVFTLMTDAIITAISLIETKREEFV